MSVFNQGELMETISTQFVNDMCDNAQNLGFVYTNSNGAAYAATQSSIYLIGAVAIATIVAVGCCCTRWCTKPTPIINITEARVPTELEKITPLVFYITACVGFVYKLYGIFI